MDQRKQRTARLAKNNTNDNSMGPPPPHQVSDGNEAFEVTALAISPSLEETTNNAPAAECRRSSRKKIIKFDVRDLLNKNRKPHKIQIEARIDSNAPTTSKSSTFVGDAASATSTFTSGDLLSKQKTFLEKSAIFRRYSISQEPKPPPLPLPPSLLAKTGDSKDSMNSGGSNPRRLSRTQDFFSNVMIKPKQPTSLIVAQMESSAPSSAMTGKRKILNKSLDLEPTTSVTTESVFSNSIIQKRRGRPSKLKTQSSEEDTVANVTKEDTNVKKLTPDKATNWKEYKACLAQQSVVTKEGPSVKSSESLTSDVVLEISSSSSYSSNIEDIKDSAKEFTAKEQQNKKDCSTKINILAEIVIEDSKDEEILKEVGNKDEVASKELPTTNQPIKDITKQIDIDETTENIQKKDDEKEEPLEEDNKERTKAEDEKSMDFLEKDKLSETSQTSQNESIEKRKKTKLNESLQKETNLKGNKSPTNLENILQQSSSKDKPSPINLEDTLEKNLGQTTEKCDQTKLNEKEQEKAMGNKKIEESITKEIDTEENKSSNTLADSLKNEKDSTEMSSKDEKAENPYHHKKDDTLPKKMRDQTIPDDSLSVEKVKCSEEQLDRNNIQLGKDLKESKSIKEVTIGRRSRSKRVPSPQDEIESTASPSIKERKSNKRSLTRMDVSLQNEDLLKTPESNKNSRTIKAVGQLNTDDDSQKISAIKSLESQSTKEEAIEKVSDSEKICINLDSEVSKCISEEIGSTTDSSTKKDVIRTSNKIKEVIEPKDDIIKTSATKQEQENKNLSNKSDQIKSIEAADNDKALSNKSNEMINEENLEVQTKTSKKTPDNNKKSSIKQTTRSKIHVNKSEETTQNMQDITDSPTDKKGIKNKMNEMKTKEENINEQVADSCKEERKTIEPINNVEQIAEEVASQIPTTPSENKSITFSRTSSSSESENMSERSSYSSATSSSSTSTRSYKSGDKLKVSVKRISLPASPSASSQTSTSDEQNSPLGVRPNEENKKKPPTAKRSKRLQNKFIEKQKDSIENIDDCFQKIPTDDKREIENKNDNVVDNVNVTKKINEVIADELTEKIKDIGGHTLSPKSVIETEQTINNENDMPCTSKLQKEQLQDVSNEKSTVPCETSKEEDLMKPTTSKAKSAKDYSTLVTRKSLRNRKENDTEEKEPTAKEVIKDGGTPKEEELLEKPTEQINESKNVIDKTKIEEQPEPPTEMKSESKEQLEIVYETRQQQKRKSKDQHSDNGKDQEIKKQDLETSFEGQTEKEEQQEVNTEKHPMSQDKVTEKKQTIKEKLQEKDKEIMLKDEDKQLVGTPDVAEIEVKPTKASKIKKSSKSPLAKTKEIEVEVEDKQHVVIPVLAEVEIKTTKETKGKKTSKSPIPKSKEVEAVDKEELVITPDLTEVEIKPTKEIKTRNNSKSPTEKLLNVQTESQNKASEVKYVESSKLKISSTEDKEYSQTLTTRNKSKRDNLEADNEDKQPDITEVEAKPTKGTKGKKGSKSPIEKSKEIDVADNEEKKEKLVIVPDLSKVELRTTKETKGKNTSKSPIPKSEEIKVEDKEELFIPSNKDNKSRKSSKSPTEKLEAGESESQNKNSEVKYTDSSKSTVFTTEGKKYSQTSPTRNKTDRENLSAAKSKSQKTKLIDIEVAGNEDKQLEVTPGTTEIEAKSTKGTKGKKSSKSPIAKSKEVEVVDKEDKQLVVPDLAEVEIKTSKEAKGKKTSSKSPIPKSKEVEVADKEDKEPDPTELQTNKQTKNIKGSSNSKSTTEKIQDNVEAETQNKTREVKDTDIAKPSVSSTEHKEYSQPSPTRSKSGQENTTAAKPKSCTVKSKEIEVADNEELVFTPDSTEVQTNKSTKKIQGNRNSKSTTEKLQDVGEEETQNKTNDDLKDSDLSKPNVSITKHEEYAQTPPTRSKSGRQNTSAAKPKSSAAKSKDIEVVANMEDKQPIVTPDLDKNEIKPTKDIESKKDSKSPTPKSKEIEVDNNEEKASKSVTVKSNELVVVTPAVSPDLVDVELKSTKPVRGRKTLRSPTDISKEIKVADCEDKQLIAYTDLAEVEIKPTKQIKGKNKSVTAKLQVEQEPQIETSQVKDIDSVTLSVSSSVEKECSQPSPKANKSGGGLKSVKSVAKETTKELSKTDIKENEPSTRSKTVKRKTISTETTESPKSSTKISEDAVKIDDKEVISENEPPKTEMIKEKTMSVETEETPKTSGNLSEKTNKLNDESDIKSCKSFEKQENRPSVEAESITKSVTEVNAKQKAISKKSKTEASTEKESAPSTDIKETLPPPGETPIKVITKETEKEDSNKNPTEDTNLYTTAVTEQMSPTPCSSTKTKSDKETPSSAKRKSLRNQKEKMAEVLTLSSSSMESNNPTKHMFDDSIFTLNKEEHIEKAKMDEIMKTNLEETIKMPKRKGRKSRFKNLHGPETESETEGSTGKQTPIEEIMLKERKDNKTPIPIEKVEDKDDQKEVMTGKYIKEITNENEKVLKAETSTDVTQSNIEEKTERNDNNSDVLPILKGKKEKTALVSQTADSSFNAVVSKLEEKQPSITASSESSYLIQNVSIETNTLLDILRTVKSNTAAAALEANKSPTIDNKNIEDPINKDTLQITVTKSEELPTSTSQEDNVSQTTLKPLQKLESDSNTNSPSRSETASPITLKKVSISPTRSDSSSPLTLKKAALSPARSDTSSPLTLKKVTRRYERRSRRGEESGHKTLEETFAEIAAQSSKAVLAAKTFGGNEVLTVLENEKEEVEKQLGEIKDQSAIEIVKEDKSASEVIDDTENPSLAKPENVETIEKSQPEVVEKVSTEVIIEKSEDNLCTDISMEISESKQAENELETPEPCKITPARRGRKPKNRPIEVSSPATKDITTKSPSKAKKDMEKSAITTRKDTGDIGGKESEEQALLSEKQETVRNEGNSKMVSAIDPTREEINKEDTSDIVKDDKQQDPAKEFSELKQSPETSTKVGKKNIKKRDTSKELSATAAEDDTPPLEVSNKLKEDDERTPKQATKKRDASLTKSETKSNSKKSAKKTKNNEEELLTAQKEDINTTPPSKRGRKPKIPQEPSQATSNSKKKTKKEAIVDNTGDDDDDGILGENKKEIESESESFTSSLDKSFDEKMAKKKRQKKLKEDFEAALIDNVTKDATAIFSSTSSTSSFGLTLLNKSPPPERRPSLVTETIRVSCITPIEPEEDPDPLKDIEKFIADGVNLLKKDYKLDEDSVDDVINPTTTITTTITPSQTNEEDTTTVIKSSTDDDKLIFNTFETPADTPITTPSVTPPPKSPNSTEPSTPDENCGVRRSHRIKKTPKALVGRGLVRDKERFSMKDDIETKSHYTLDDHLTDLAEVEAKNAKFLKEMEERLSNFQVIKENEYLCERVISKEARKMICDCFLTHEEEERGELGCGEDCLNRLLMIECGFECNVKERCTNKRFQKLLCSPCRVFRTEKKGFGIMADIEILPGEFILEYVGEVIDTNIFEQRRIMYSQDKNRHYYFMALRSDAIIDATIKGNISRFINHSCDPNAETQKWTVNGELRIGFFSRKSIMPGEEITFNYQYQRYGREAQRCYCESSNCRGWIGPEPTSDEGEQIDDDDEDESEDDDEEEEELQDTSSLLVQDDDEDSDASVTDPEEVQKQLEMAAAQAEVELAPIIISEEPTKPEVSITTADNKETDDSVKPETPEEEEEDSKSKFKKLLSKMAEKVAAKQKQNKREQKLQRKKKSKESSSDLSNKLRFLEDPDIEDEVEFLRECGLKNQSDTLRLSRLMVRAKLVQTRLNLLDILRQGDLPCRRLFLDYHGLRLVHGWMSEDAGNMQIRLALLQTLETLPIANKTVLTDSKVMQVVRNWCGSSNTVLSPNEDSSSSNSNSQDVSLENTSSHLVESSEELQKLALKLITTWDGLPEIFRIPKKERIEQMKEHEREADRQYAANAETEENKFLADRYRRDRFGKSFNSSANTSATTSNRFTKPNNGNPLRSSNATTSKNDKNLSKAERREMFAAKVARDEAEKRMAEERREFETKCRFFGLDPKKTRPQDVPFYVNPSSGQWFSVERKPIVTPPSYAHVQVPVKPKSTDPNDYQLPGVCSTLPPQWKFAITTQGKIYYYHVKYRIPQWEPPTLTQLQLCEMEEEEGDSESELTTTVGDDSSEEDDDDEILIGMDAVQLRAYIERRVEVRRQKRYQRLVDQRAISPRREEDRIYNQIEVRKYKENKEKIRKRKEEIRRKRAEALRQSSLNMCTLGSITDTSVPKLQTESDEELGVLPIQDYLLSSDEEIDLKAADIINPLIDKIVEGDKIVDELDALTSKRQLKRPLPPHRDFNEPSTSTAAIISSIERQEYKKRKLEKKEKRKPKDQDAKYRKNKEKFRCEIAGIIVHHLKPYRKDSTAIGRIKSNEDFNHLARKLTHFVVIKELKYCDSVGQTLVVTESVKNKSREFIKKYMAKYNNGYVKPLNDPDFKDIPFTL